MTLSYILIFCLGLIFGSFANVLIYRLPRNENFVSGRSRCPQCRKTLSWYDLIPLLSFLTLNGQCRHCGKKISWQYFVIELCSGVLFLAVYLNTQNLSVGASIFSFLILAILLETFLILFMTDLKYLILPDKIVFFALGAVIVFGALEKLKIIETSFGFLNWPNILTGLIFSAVLLLLWLVSGGRWIGLGDSKLAALIGLVFGPVGGAMVIYIAIVIGALTGIFLLITKLAKLESKLPLGTFICLSAILYFFAGSAIIKLADSLGLYTVLSLFK